MMSFSKLLRRFLLIFLISAIILPISSTFLFLLGWILHSFGDETGRSVLNAFSLLSTGLWGVSLIGLLLILTIDKLIE